MSNHYKIIYIDGDRNPVGHVSLPPQITDEMISGMVIVPEIILPKAGTSNHSQVPAWRLVDRTKVDTRSIEELIAAHTH